MKVELLYIRMDQEFQQKDLENLEKFLARVKLKQLQTAFVEANPSYWSVMVLHEEKRVTNNKFSVENEEDLSKEDKEVLKYLKAWRKDKGEQLGTPLFMICHNKELMSIAKARPKSTEELLKIKGFGKYKTEKFGEDIIVMLNAM